MAKRKKQKSTGTSARLVSLQMRDKKLKKASNAIKSAAGGEGLKISWDDLADPVIHWQKSLRHAISMLVLCRLKAQEKKDEENILKLAKFATDLKSLNELFKDVYTSLSGKKGEVSTEDIELYVSTGSNLYDILLPKIEDIHDILIDISDMYGTLVHKPEDETAVAEV